MNIAVLYKKLFFKYFVLFVLAILICLYVLDKYLPFAYKNNQILDLNNKINKYQYLQNKEKLSIPEVSGIDIKEIDFNDKNIKKQLETFVSNLYFLSGDFENALKSNNYFNLGNISLYKGFYNIFSGVNINQMISGYQSLIDAKTYYKQATKQGNSQEKQIIYNNNYLDFLIYLGNIRLCESIFSMINNKIDDILSKINELKDIISKQINLIDLYKTNDQNIKKCLQEYKDMLSKSYMSLQIFSSFLSDTKISIQNNIGKAINQKLNCFDERQNLVDGTSKSFQNIENNLNKFLNDYTAMSDALKDQSMLEKICKNGTSGQSDDTLAKEMQNLKNLLNPQSSSKQSNTEKKQDKQSGNQKQHENVDPKLKDALMQSIKQKANNWLDEMYNIKGDGNYDAQNYIQNLFEEFLGNKKDFENKYEGDGPKYDSDGW